MSRSLRIEKQACAALLMLLSPLALAVEVANQDPHAHHQMASAELDATLIEAAADELGARQLVEVRIPSGKPGILPPSPSPTRRRARCWSGWASCSSRAKGAG